MLCCAVLCTYVPNNALSQIIEAYAHTIHSHLVMIILWLMRVFQHLQSTQTVLEENEGHLFDQIYTTSKSHLRKFTGFIARYFNVRTYVCPAA